MRKTLRYLFYCVFAMAIAASFVACDDGNKPEPPVTPPVAETYVFTFSTENEVFGSVSCKDVSGVAVISGNKFEKDTALTVTATANTGYTFDGWYQGTEKKSDISEYSFTMPESDLTLVAKFAVNTYALNYSSESTEKGNVESTTASGTDVAYKTSVTVTANANAGYTFLGWYEGTAEKSTNPTYTFEMPANAVTLVAKFTTKTYVLTYSSESAEKGNVESTTASGTDVVYKTSVTVTATANTGYDFFGWYEDEMQVSSDAVYNFDMPDKPITLQARFKVQKRTVNFYVDADVIGIKQVDYNTAAPTSEVVAEKTGGFEFVNWFTDPEFKNVYGGEPIKSSTDLYAKFNVIIISYRVRFFDYDGSKIGGDQTVEQGNEASMPADQQRVGYNFTGWAFNNEPIAYGFKVNCDMDIYATYTEKTYDVHFYLESSVEMSGSPKTVKHGETVAKPSTPTKTDYVFIRWLLDNEYEFDFDTKITDDLELYAEWKAVEKPTYTVRFYDDLGGTLIDTQIVEEGGDATAPQTPEKSGKTFKEWSGDYTNVTTNVEIYATYDTATFEVTFAYYDDVQHKDVESKVVVDYGTAATAPTTDKVQKTGYTFDGWDKAFTNVNEDIKVTALYTVNNFTATFYLGSEVHAIEMANYGATFKIPSTPNVAGYSFMGWFKDTGHTIPFDFTVPATENVEVHGKLEEIVIQTYTVRFLDYDNRVISEQTVVEHEAASAPGNPSRTGYTFVGWNSTFAEVTENLTIRATYTPNKYTITYYKEDGITLIDTKQADYGSDASNLVEAPVVTGKEFLRWSKDLTVVTKNTEVHAIYAKNIVTVRFIDEDGIAQIGVSQSVEYGGHASIPNTPTKTGCIFKAWVVSVGSDEIFDFNSVITAETEIFAKWENVSGVYSVYFEDYDGNAYGNIQRVVAGFTAIQPSDPVKAGVIFGGWYIKDTDDEFDFDTPITQAITLVARAKAD